MSAHVPVTAEELAEIARLTSGPPRHWKPAELSAVRTMLPRLAHDLAERTAERDAEIERRERNEGALIVERDEAIEERDALSADVERLIREAGAIRNDERQRAKAEHEALDDAGRQRDASRIERLEGELARLRVIVDDADRVKAEHEKTHDELRRLHDVLSGKRGAP